MLKVTVKKLDEIIVPEDRFRKVFVQKDLDDLETSITGKELFHAIGLRADGATLAFGERRFRAIKQLAAKGLSFTYNGEEIKPGYVPVVITAADSDLDAKEIEVLENIRRVDMTPQEKARAVGELHELRSSQKAAKGETQTKRDTALEAYPEERDPRSLGSKINDVTRDLVIAQFLEDPDVAKAKTATDALKLITKKVEQKRLETLAKNYDISKLEGGDHEIIQGDVFEKLPEIEDGVYDCIIADPPYGIGADTFANQSAAKHSYSDTKEYADHITNFILSHSLRITRRQAHLYIFCDILRFPELKKMVIQSGWYVWNTPLIWFKGASVGVAPRPEHGPRRTYEALLYAIKGDKKITTSPPSDVIAIPHDRMVERAAHKPADLYAELIRRSCSPGERVLDPTCGTGPIFTAADKCRVTATGIEIDTVAIAMCYERIENG